MKIVQIMPNFGLAGAETMCENLVYELKKLGHTVTVVSMYDFRSAITERLENAGVDIRYLGKKRGLDISMIGKIKKVLKEIRPDVIHTHRYCPQYAMPAAILAGVKGRVHTVHNIAEKENGRAGRKFNKFFFKHCGMIPVALSELVKDSIVAEYGVPEEKIPVVYNGSDLSKCTSKTDFSVEGNFKLLHIGRFSEQKNHNALIAAFQSFHAVHPNSELWLVGDGEKREEIASCVQENGLAENVKFCGLTDNVYEYLNKADAFTLPSRYEGSPITLIEAMGSGLPIVATAVGGVPDMLTNEESALLTAVDEGEIAQAFGRLAEDRDLRERLGKNALARAEAFSAQTMAEKYLEIYGACKR